MANYTVAVSNFPSSATVQVRIYDVTGAATHTAWTSTGVSELANGEGTSVYYYTADLTAGSCYIINWKDDTSPVNTADELITETMTSSMGPLTGVSQATITVDDGTNPLPGVIVGVYNSTNTVLVDKKTTGGSGTAVFALADGTYKIRLSLAGYTFTVPETLTVSGTTTDTYSGASLTVTSPGVASTIRIYDWVYSQDSSAHPSTVVATAEIIELPYNYNTRLHVGSVVDGTYNSTTGLVYWDVPYGCRLSVSIQDVYPRKAVTAPTSGTTVRLATL